ncbi:MAG: T9SS type A sorting domain-containing protein [Flavobacteriales bacterium]|nr:T9SS type A sorting domain-containing protein [Bacteroidota bacterium]MCB9241248.1 T9SS type A sorting domain-containing protein [Flavobacteriales bacterium]
MPRLYLTAILSIISGALLAQNSWSNNIAQLVYDNCSNCHNPNGIAPFSLLDYSAAKNRSASIRTAVALRNMPPWIADTDYQSYSHARVLSESEIKAITDWVDAGAPEGDAAKTPPPPVYATKGYITKTPDLELKMPVYSSKATNAADDYICFSVPSGLTVDKKIKAFEVIPGNHNIVHHTLVYIDETGTYKTDTTGAVCTGPTRGLIGGYVPGSPPTIFPGNGQDFNLGFEIKAGSNIVLAMHYPEGSFGMLDSTKVRFWFYDDQVSIRELETKSLIENWSFALPPNQITPVSATKKMSGSDYSMLSVFPHMHLLGNTIRSYAITPNADTLKFVNINHWDFEWQEFLFFDKIIKLPEGSVIRGEGDYDNSSNNHHNPNNPPILVRPGLNTSDEMFLIYFHYLPYVSGDENIDVNALRSLSSESLGWKSSPLLVFPNPANDVVHFKFPNTTSSQVLIHIYDVLGNKVGEMTSRDHQTDISWTIPDQVVPGVYFYSMNCNGTFATGSFMIK